MWLLTGDVAQSILEYFLLDRLVRDVDDVTDKLPDGIIKARDLAQKSLVVYVLLPKLLKLTLLQQIGQICYSHYIEVFSLAK